MFFYLSSCLGSSMIATVLRAATILPRLSQKGGNAQVLFRQPGLGASGAVLACFALVSNMFPDSEWYLMFIPYAITASTLFKCAVAFDTAGLLWTLRKVSMIGHHAHLGGAAFGYAYFRYLEQFRARGPRANQPRGQRPPRRNSNGDDSSSSSRR
jgi:rhomboid-like protein